MALLTDIQLTKRASDYLIKIKSGINPITGNKIEDWVSLFQEERILRCFEYSAKFLMDYCKLLEKRKFMVKVLTIESDKLHITKTLNTTKEYVGSKNIASYLNNVKKGDIGKPVRGNDLLEGLSKLGFVQKVEGRKDYPPTAKGISAGLVPHVFVSPKSGKVYGTYPIFELKAQQYVLEHLSEILPDWKITILNA